MSGLSRLERCEGCGEVLEVGARFCTNCGRPAGAGSSPASSGAGGMPGGGTARAAAHVTGGTGMDPGTGEFKQASVLFADLEGSVALAEQVDAEEWHQIISTIFGILARSARRYGGTVSRFTGDGIMALFGAPAAQEDHAARACHAALHARESLLGYAADLRRTQGLSFSFRMGVNSGPVVAARLPEAGGGGHTAIGPTVLVAERMERLAEPGHIYVTEATAMLVGALFDLRDLGTFRLRGAANPLHAFELRGESAQSRPLEFGRSRGFSRFVGREAEIAILESALDRADEGHGCVVEVVGDAGIGKSRLCSEFLSECRRRGHATLEWRGVSHLSNTPYLGFVEGLRRMLGIDPRLPEADARQTLDAAMREIDPGIDPYLPVLHDLLGVTADPSIGDPGSQAYALGVFVERIASGLS